MTSISPRRPDPTRPQKVGGPSEPPETADAKPAAGRSPTTDSFERGRLGQPAAPKMSPGDVARLRETLGPAEGKAGPSDLDEKLGSLFEKHGMGGAREAATKAGAREGMDQALVRKNVDGLRAHLAGSTGAGRTAVIADLKGVLEMDAPHGDVMAALFSVFKDSIQATNEDKRYFLTKLKMYNDMGEELSNYLSDLVDTSRDLGALAAGQKYPEMTEAASVGIRPSIDPDAMKAQVAGALQAASAQETRGMEELGRILDALGPRSEKAEPEPKPGPKIDPEPQRRVDLDD